MSGSSSNQDWLSTWFFLVAGFLLLLFFRFRREPGPVPEPTAPSYETDHVWEEGNHERG